MESLFSQDLADIVNLSVLTAILFIVIFMRYIILSGLYHLLFFKVFRNEFSRRFLHRKSIETKQIRLEIKWSLISAALFSFAGSGMLLAWQKGYSLIYTDLHAYAWWWLPLSFALYMLIHETYYYWLHRWMHQPKVYKAIHKVHHESIYTNSFTSFSFHPVESVLQAAIIPLLTFIVPIHWILLLILLLLMTISAIVNHAGVEVYPDNKIIHKNLIGATHHDLHHKQFRFNFGLYFTFWDRWMKTESPDTYKPRNK
ncbi:MAG: sterol desaturase family protein [Cyclobacteriaceae bacterium]